MTPGVMAVCPGALFTMCDRIGRDGWFFRGCEEEGMRGRQFSIKRIIRFARKVAAFPGWVFLEGAIETGGFRG